MRLHRISFIAGLVFALLLGHAAVDTSSAQAQCEPGVMTDTCNLVGADGKGILGGLILGAEIGFLTNALIVHAGVQEMDEWWAWILIPSVTAAAGAIGGYYALEDPNMGQGFPEAAVAVFAVSMALIVPTFVGVLALTAYQPGAETSTTGATGEQDAAAGEPIETETNTAEPIGAASPNARERVLAGGPGALRFDRGRLLLGIPMVYSADTYTAEERAHMQLPRSSDIRVPVVSGVF